MSTQPTGHLHGFANGDKIICAPVCGFVQHFSQGPVPLPLGTIPAQSSSQAHQTAKSPWSRVTWVGLLMVLPSQAKPSKKLS